MPNIASALKSEISRIARKEIRAEIDSLKKAANTYRSEIAALKRRALSLEHDLRTLAKASPKSAAAPAEDPDAAPRRFSAKGLASQRKRLGLSADAVGLLIGTTGQSIYNWEAGKARPRHAHLAAIAALKTLSKKTAAAVLASRKSAA